MKQQNWHRTDLDVTNALRLNLKDYLLSDPYREGEHNIYIENTVGVWTIAPQTIFTDKFLGYLADNLLLQVDLAQIFYRTSGYQHPGAHVDLGQNNKLYGCGLNWTVDPDDAEMVWYDMPTTEGVSTKRSETDRNMEWPLEQLKEIDRVAYIRFASVYRDFKDVESFKSEVDSLLVNEDSKIDYNAQLSFLDSLEIDFLQKTNRRKGLSKSIKNFQTKLV